MNCTWRRSSKWKWFRAYYSSAYLVLADTALLNLPISRKRRGDSAKSEVCDTVDRGDIS